MYKYVPSLSTLHALSSHKSPYAIRSRSSSSGGGAAIDFDDDEELNIAEKIEMALGNDLPSSYIHMVHHLIEKCMTFGMSMEECMEALSRRADVQPVVTSTVWKELEKENKEFFDQYKQWRTGKGDENYSSSSSSSSSS